MKVLAVSDMVEERLYARPAGEEFEEIELILSCGDLPPEYLAFLVNRFEVPLFFVKGNHDLRLAKNRPWGCTDIHARIVLFRGVRFLGLEGSRWYNGGPLQYTDYEMRRIIKGLRWRLWRSRGVDVVISHAPPRLVHDAEDRCHRGFDAFHPFIERYGPRYFVHGHIHTDFKSFEQRATLVSSTLVINTFGYTVFDIDLDRGRNSGKRR